MKMGKDGKGQPFIEWTQAPGGYKRAWIQKKTDAGKDWAATPGGRYLNVVRIEAPGGGPAGNATDFPIFSDAPDEQILVSFVTAVSAITGCQLKVDPVGLMQAKVDPAGITPLPKKLFKVDPAG